MPQRAVVEQPVQPELPDAFRLRAAQRFDDQAAAEPLAHLVDAVERRDGLARDVLGLRRVEAVQAKAAMLHRPLAEIAQDVAAQAVGRLAVLDHGLEPPPRGLLDLFERFALQPASSPM